MLHEALRNETEAPGSQNSNYPPSKKRESIDDEANQKKLTALTKQLTQMFQSSRKNFEQWIAKAITRKWKVKCAL